jgi:hypothetical protein
MPFSSADEFEKLARLDRSIWGDDEDEVLMCLDVSQEDIYAAFRGAGIDVPIPAASVTLRIKEIECWLACYRYMFDKFDPTNEADKKIEKRWDLALKWLEAVAAKDIHPLPLTPAGNAADATPDVEIGAAGTAYDDGIDFGVLMP